MNISQINFASPQRIQNSQIRQNSPSFGTNVNKVLDLIPKITPDLPTEADTKFIKNLIKQLKDIQGDGRKASLDIVNTFKDKSYIKYHLKMVDDSNKQIQTVSSVSYVQKDTKEALLENIKELFKNPDALKENIANFYKGVDNKKSINDFLTKTFPNINPKK